MKQKHRPFYLVIALAALVLALALAACGSSNSETSEDTGSTQASGGDNSKTLRVGVLPGFALKQELEASGQLEQIDYEIDFQEYPGAGPQWMETVRTGNTDIAAIAPTPLIFGQAANAQVKAVAAFEWMKPGESVNETLVHGDSDIKDTADLKGKTVAVNEGSLTQYYFAKSLEAAGLSLSDIKPANLLLGESATAFEADQVDSLATPDPFRLNLLKAGSRAIAAETEVLPPSLLIWAVSDEALESRADQIEDFISHMKKAEEWADEHPEEWGKIVGEVVEVDAKTGQELVERRRTNYVDVDAAVVKASQEQADFFTQIGVLPEKLDVSVMYDERFNGVFSEGNKYSGELQ